MKLSSVSQKTIIYSVIILASVAIITVVTSHILYAQYTGVGNHVVSMSEGQHYIQNFRNNRVAPTTNGVYFDRNIYDKILAQPGCVGIRQYFAQTDEKIATLVLVGVDAKGNDLINGVIGELSQACPPFCAPDTKLY